MPKGTTSKVVSKKHLARVERERIQTRYLIIGSAIVLILVIALIGYGIAQQYLIQPRQPVAKVGDDVITTREFQTFARYTRMQLIQQYQQYEQFAQLFGNDPNNQSFIQQYLAQINFQLEPTMLGQTVLDRLIENRIIRNEAAARGITVSSEEIDAAVEEMFSYYPGGTPTTEPTRPVIPTSTLSPTQLALFPPTPTITATQVTTEVLATETPTPTPFPTATPSGPTPTAPPQPTATEYTQDLFEKDFQNYMNTLDTVVDIREADMRWIIEMQLYRQKLYDVITADIAREQDQVWARQIVVADEAAAQQVISRLEAGEDFAALATELSTDANTAAQGGDLGWFGIGQINADVEKIVFNLSIGQVSDPITTTDGWVVVQTLGHEVRQLTDQQYDQALNQAFQNWLDGQRSVLNVEIFDIWQDRVPIYPTIPPSQ